MKKDQKFLNNLDKALGRLHKSKKNAIISKYRNIIDEELKNKNKIVQILKNIGTPEEVAKKELEEIKNNSLFKKIFSKKNKKDNTEISEEEKESIKEDVSEIREEEKKEKLDEVKEKIEDIKKETKKTIDKSKQKITKGAKKLKKDTNKNANKVKENFKGFFKNIFKKFKKEKKIVIEEHTEMIEEVSDVLEEITETKIFESKKHRRIRITLKVLGVILVIILLFSLLWTSTLFAASLFAVLDGVRFYGINLGLFGILGLNVWLLLIVNRLVFNKKINFRLALYSIIAIFICIGTGAAWGLNSYRKTENVTDVSDKYSMSTSYETYTLPKDTSKELLVTFNSNYDTKYVIEYDNTLVNKFKVEVKYYECYYDFYEKRTTNNLYISLKQDLRDRISVYIENLKDKLIYDDSELGRYTVRIVMNEQDQDRIVIN